MASYPFVESESNQGFLKDWISLYASTPFELNDKSIRLLNTPSSDSLNEIHEKTSGRKKNNNVEIDGKVNMELLGRGNGRRQWSFREDMYISFLVMFYFYNFCHALEIKCLFSGCCCS